MEHSVNYFHLLVSSSSDRLGVCEVDRIWIYFRIPLGVVSLLEERWIRDRVDEEKGWIMTVGWSYIGTLGLVLLSPALVSFILATVLGIWV